VGHPSEGHQDHCPPFSLIWPWHHGKKPIPTLPENVQTSPEMITFSVSWRLRLLFQMINETLFAFQSWGLCRLGSHFMFYVSSIAFDQWAE
jgi:hypothetical protein